MAKKKESDDGTNLGRRNRNISGKSETPKPKRKTKAEIAEAKRIREQLKAERERKKAMKAAEAEAKAKKKAEREAKKAAKEAAKIEKENAKIQAEKNAKDITTITKKMKIASDAAFYPDKKDVEIIHSLFNEKTTEKVDISKRIVLQYYKNREFMIYEMNGDEYTFRLESDVYFFNKKTNFVVCFGPVFTSALTKENTPWNYEKLLTVRKKKTS